MDGWMDGLGTRQSCIHETDIFMASSKSYCFYLQKFYMEPFLKGCRVLHRTYKGSLRKKINHRMVLECIRIITLLCWTVISQNGHLRDLWMTNGSRRKWNHYLRCRVLYMNFKGSLIEINHRTFNGTK